MTSSADTLISTPRWQLNPRARWTRFDAASPAQAWLVEVDGVAGSTRRFTVSERTRDLLLRIDACGGPDPSIRPLLDPLSSEAADADTAADSALQALAAQWIEQGLLLSSEPATATQPPRTRPSYMLAMIPLLPPRGLNRLGPILARLFAPRALVVGLLAICTGLTLLARGLMSPPLFATFDSGSVLLTLALAAFGLLLHELGHAMAAYRFGARSVSIGIGWYLVMPVAYADLSEIWRFSRRQRAIVDLAGVYMQLLWVLALMIGYEIGNDAALLTAASATAVSVLWNLNPLLRMDGYWLLADLLGIANLRAMAMDELRSACLRAVGRPAPPRRVAGTLAAGLIVYAIVASAFLTALLVWAIRFLAASISTTIPQKWQQLSSTGLDVGDIGLLVAALLWKLLVVFMLGRFVLGAAWRLLRPLWRRQAAATA